MPFTPSDRPALSAVVPCYNEEPGIAPLVARLADACAASFGESLESSSSTTAPATGPGPRSWRPRPGPRR